MLNLAMHSLRHRQFRMHRPPSVNLEFKASLSGVSEHGPKPEACVGFWSIENVARKAALSITQPFTSAHPDFLSFAVLSVISVTVGW